MNSRLNETPSGVYLFNPEISQQQIFDAMSACLCKAEALASTAAAIDFEIYTPETINNYLWALSDTLREAKLLCSKINPCDLTQ